MKSKNDNKLIEKIKCAITHNIEVCDNCKMCGESGSSIRVDLLHELDKIQDKLKVLEIIKRICKNKENYINAEFDDNNFYIDGLTHYKNEEEKEIIKEWLNNDK